jgi:hypothetical protein
MPSRAQPEKGRLPMTAMNSQQLIELLHAVLRGETQVD